MKPCLPFPRSVARNRALMPLSLSFGTQPSAVNAGATMSSVTVKVTDALGRTVTSGLGSNGTITLALTTPGGATLGGTVAVACVAGVATFSDLRLDKNGTYTLTASATGLTSATSDSFAVAALTVADFERADSEYLSYADNVAFEFNGVDFYGSVYYRPESLVDWVQLCGKFGASGQREWKLQINASGIVALTVSNDGTATANAISTDALQVGTWGFIEWWHRNGVGIAVRINRGTAVTQAHTTGLHAGSSAFRVSSTVGNSTDYADGLVANFYLSSEVSISGASIGTPDATISADLYNGGVIPPVSFLDSATIAAAKRSGGAAGDLFWPLNEASGNRVSHSGNFTLTDNNTVGSASAA